LAAGGVLTLVFALLAGMFGVAPPAAAGPSTFLSDDFSSSVLQPQWTITDPVGDGSVALTGSGTADARLSLALPAGVAHDAWLPNQSLRVTQPMVNEDFTAEMKFDSVPTKKFQQQGLQVEQDADNWLRADYFHNGSNLKFYVATITNGAAQQRVNVNVGTPPGSSLWLRVNRAGNQWTISTSTDGAAWTTRANFSWTTTANRIGAFAGTAGNNPAWTALVDYFFNTASPVAPEDPPGPPDTTPPQVSGVTVNPAATSAQLSWATNEATTSRVDYGPTAAYGASVTDSTLSLNHTASLTGLAPATTYHYAITATDAATNSTTTTNATFTTGPPAFLSDDFSSSVLQPQWSITDPLGDGTVALTGSGTSNARLSLSVPGGVAHDAWFPNNSLRATQPMANEDFSAELKFDSAPTKKFQQQGVQVRQDADNWFRADYFHNGSNLKFYAATITAGVAKQRVNVSLPAPTGGSLWLRVDRTGNQWTVSSSPDGTSWTTQASFSWTITANTIGPFAGNAGNNPAWTALVDYFFNTAAPVDPEDPGGPPDTTPPQISGVTVTPSATSAQLSWVTDEATTSRIDYGTTSAYGTTVTDSNLSLNHSLPLTGLTPSTTYHYRITATDAATNSTSTSNATFTTIAGVSSFVSDDFSSSVLKPQWSITDPLGDGTAALTGSGTSNARLSLSVPAGVAHDTWLPNNSLRAVQPVTNGNFQSEIKFDSVPTLRYQQQGLQVHQDGNTWLRSDYFHDGSSLRVFVATITNGSATTRANVSVPAPAGSSLWMRVNRTGNQWTVSTSPDGSTWTSRASFSWTITANTIGASVGNAPAAGLGTAPAFTALVDYLFDTASPISPEDPVGPPPPDSTPPTISGVSVTPSGTTATIRWLTNENANARVDYGLTSAYGAHVSDPSLTLTHSVTLTGLSPSTTYHYRIRSTDAATNTTTTTNATFTTNTSPPGPVIDVWYGPTQSVGTPGLTQRWVNVLGNVSGPNPITSMTYRLNGGPSRNLSLGPNLRRLVNPGDFVVEALVTDLQPGANTVVLTAVDSAGTITTSNVTINNTTPAPLWPTPTTINWNGGDVTDHGVVVDGEWYIDNGNLRTVTTGYDRLVAVGDMRWTDYEVTVPITIHSVVLGQPFQSGAPLIGIIYRWNGHNNTITPGSQPQQGWLPDGVNPSPLGGIAMIRWNSMTSTPLQLWNHRAQIAVQSNNTLFQLGTTYNFKVRVETLQSGNTQYSFKVWTAGTPEPGSWNLQHLAGTSDFEPASGSIVLDAHEADVTFGDVSIIPL
jgi:regulation of enolase protein 1 (concanavalin A-like superfamily)